MKAAPHEDAFVGVCVLMALVLVLVMGEAVLLVLLDT